MSLRRGTWRRALRDAALLPVALLIVLLEEVVWRGAHVLLRRLGALPAVRALSVSLAGLPGWAALPLFLVPEAAGRVGELWAAWLLYNGHPRSAVLAYVIVRLLATLIVVFIWQACAPALLRLRWFARATAWVRAVRDWSLARTAGLRRMLRGAGRSGGLSWRLGALRRRLHTRWRP